MRCNGSTLAGKPCKRPSQVSGYCINHITVSHQKQSVTKIKQPKMDYSKNPPIIWEDIRKTKMSWHKWKLINAYHKWIREKRTEDKLKLRR